MSEVWNPLFWWRMYYSPPMEQYALMDIMQNQDLGAVTGQALTSLIYNNLKLSQRMALLTG